jgi:hypothetical protein
MSTNIDTSKMDRAGVDAGAKILVGLRKGAPGCENAGTAQRIASAISTQKLRALVTLPRSLIGFLPADESFSGILTQLGGHKPEE